MHSTLTALPRDVAERADSVNADPVGPVCKKSAVSQRSGPPQGAPPLRRVTGGCTRPRRTKTEQLGASGPALRPSARYSAASIGPVQSLKQVSHAVQWGDAIDVASPYHVSRAFVTHPHRHTPRRSHQHHTASHITGHTPPPPSSRPPSIATRPTHTRCRGQALHRTAPTSIATHYSPAPLSSSTPRASHAARSSVALAALG